MVDLHVSKIELAGEEPDNLSRAVRKQITGVLREQCLINGHETSILIATEECVESLARALEKGCPGDICLPEFCLSASLSQA